MNTRARSAMVSGPITLALASTVSFGQSPSNADVTFQVPVQLNRSPTTVTKVKVRCMITAWNNTAGFAGEVESPLVPRGVNQTMTVLVPVPAQPLETASGKTSSYECELSAHCLLTAGNPNSATGSQLGNVASTSPFRPTPAATKLTGSFVW